MVACTLHIKSIAMRCSLHFAVMSLFKHESAGANHNLLVCFILDTNCSTRCTIESALYGAVMETSCIVFACMEEEHRPGGLIPMIDILHETAKRASLRTSIVIRDGA